MTPRKMLTGINLKEVESTTFTKQRRRRITREVIIIAELGIIKLIKLDS